MPYDVGGSDRTEVEQESLESCLEIEPTQLLQTQILCVLLFWVLTIASVLSAFKLASAEPFAMALAFTFAPLAAVVGYCLSAAVDKKFPTRIGGKPKHRHITGFGALVLLGIVGGIVALATWATANPHVSQTIHAYWGAYIIFGLSIAFTAAAIIPSVETPVFIRRVNSSIGRSVAWLGVILSVLDSVLVFGVAPASGVTLQSRQARYGMLALHLTPCAILGYWLPAPWGLVPIGWALIVAVAISRRWAWVEEDREIAMLNGEFVGDHLRVGFGQDLRDESLLGFMSMFFLVPLALRQAQLWGTSLGITVFTVGETNVDDLVQWLQYYGTELAKAAPFVDWAEVYHVEGDAPIKPESAISLHIVFATRVLVDLVFLSALLQALSILARVQKQREMFYNELLHRLDPFIEANEFRKLVRYSGGRWVPHLENLDKFPPKYDEPRLSALKADTNPNLAVRTAARLVHEREYDNGHESQRLHSQLLEHVNLPPKETPNFAAIGEVLDAIVRTGRLRQLSELDDARRKLTKYTAAKSVRQRLTQMIADYNDDPEDPGQINFTSALAKTLTGNLRDSWADTREVAFSALQKPYLKGHRAAVEAILHAAALDQALSLRARIAKWVKENPPPPIVEPETPPDDGPIVFE